MARAERAGVSAMPGIVVSLIVVAAGAIARYAVTQATPGFDLHAIGIILMFVGGAGVLLSLLLWSSMSPFGHNRSTTRRETTRSRGGRERDKVVSETEESEG